VPGRLTERHRDRSGDSLGRPAVRQPPELSPVPQHLSLTGFVLSDPQRGGR